MTKGEVVEDSSLMRMPDSSLMGYKDAFKSREKSKPRISGARTISTKGGTFSIGDEDLGPYIELCIIDWVNTNTFYTGRWDPKVQRSPSCAAVGRDENDSLLPFSGDDYSPVHDACGDCPMNEWGSDPTGGKGKACKNAVRLVVAPVADVRDAQSEGRSAAQVTAYYMNVPVTSVDGLMKVIHIIEDKLVEVCAAQTNATIVAMEGGHSVEFMPATTLFPAADPEFLSFIEDLIEANQTMLLSAPRMEEEEDVAPTPNKSSRRPGGAKGAAKKGGRKAAAKKGGRKAAAKKDGVRRRRA